MSNNRINIMEDRWRVKQFVRGYSPPGNGEITSITVPVCQREWAWKGVNNYKKERFIDSVINGYPIPTVILNRTSLHQFEPYDGRHRIETIWRYANGEFTWNGKKYVELSSEEKMLFDNREIPVTIVDDATPEQLADIFTRLNSGTSLKDYDYLWAHRNTPLMSAVISLVCNSENLAEALSISLKSRIDLANWTAICAGLTTRNAGNMTTSHIRIAADVGYNIEVDTYYVTRGVNALATLYKRAFTQFPANQKDKKKFRKVGTLSAFFLADWIKSDNENATIEKWVSIIGKLTVSDHYNMKNALTTTGAQNLTASKIEKVLDQVNKYINTGLTPENASTDNEDDDE